MGCLTRDAILRADDLPRSLISVPEWGGHVYIRTLTANERDKFEARFMADKQVSMEGVRSMLASMVMVDEDGKQLFKPNDVADLGKKSGAALQRIFEAAQAANYMTNKDVEELAKNSDAVHTESSSTDSPSVSRKTSKRSSSGRRKR